MADPTLYLFDGFNLLHASSFEDVRELRDALASFVAMKGARGILVFDGSGPGERYGPLEVRYAPHVDRCSAARRSSTDRPITFAWSPRTAPFAARPARRSRSSAPPRSWATSSALSIPRSGARSSRTGWTRRPANASSDCAAATRTG